MVLLGGVHSFFGPIAGAVLFLTLAELFLILTDTYQLFLGIALLVIVLFLPEGAVGTLRNVFEQ
jgi:branched-chain amino acid transport system permease protein